jgi:hypothetical protein
MKLINNFTKSLLFSVCLTLFFFCGAVKMINVQTATENRTGEKSFAELIHAKNQSHKPFVILTPDELKCCLSDELNAPAGGGDRATLPFQLALTAS